MYHCNQYGDMFCIDSYYYVNINYFDTCHIDFNANMCFDIVRLNVHVALDFHIVFDIVFVNIFLQV